MPDPPAGRRRPLARPSAPPDLEAWYAAAVSAQPPNRASHLPRQQAAQDPTGSVQVVVNARGRAEQVVISPEWRRQLTAAGLATALLDAYRAAVGQAVEARAQGWRAAAAMARRSAHPIAASPATDRRSPDPAVDREAWRRWLEQVNASIAAQREQRARLAAIAGGASHSVTGPFGYLTAELRGLEIIAITCDAARVWHASTEHLRREALAILTTPDSRPE